MAPIRCIRGYRIGFKAHVIALLPTLSAEEVTVASPVPDGDSDGCGTSDFVRLNVPK
ncbi:hypothetical protein VSDG_04861 [Cytospora chrysosperma]|uniref:Uncharacterized protein n=1 Tax=Cytospora chrysosperma TaxID=252740 RepID=A0A423W3I5_CYTCH|nr:hypothetical protein VSDG_04861 [Valsa sordida]